MVTKNNLVSQARTMHPPPYYAVHPHAMVHHHHHHHLMQVCGAKHLMKMVEIVIMMKGMKTIGNDTGNENNVMAIMVKISNGKKR